LRALELWHLKKLCDKYDIDHQEIDDTLTYWENKRHLLSLKIERMAPLDAELRTWESMEEEYMNEHILSYYVMCLLDGATTSEEKGETPPHYPRFSLETYIQQTR